MERNIRIRCEEIGVEYIVPDDDETSIVRKRRHKNMNRHIRNERKMKQRCLLFNVNYVQPIQGESDEIRKIRRNQMTNAIRREKYKLKKQQDRENNVIAVSSSKFK